MQELSAALNCRVYMGPAGEFFLGNHASLCRIRATYAPIMVHSFSYNAISPDVLHVIQIH
jgi:hypothetical protein